MDITTCLSQTVALGGSDLHLSAWAPPCARVNGVLQALDTSPLDPVRVRDMVLDTLTETQRATLEQELELDYALQVDGVGRFRGNVHIARGHVEAAFRFVPQEVPELEQLGHHDVVAHFCWCW
jgi:twitching motility protein PilT